MTTFQALVYAIAHGMSDFLPISVKAHEILLPYLIGWQPPSGALLGALNLGSFLALFIYFRHDWASMISCFLQIVIYRRKPMTLDERIPLFLIVTSFPLLIARYYFHSRVAEMDWTPRLVTLLLIGGSLPLFLFDYLGRKSKSIFDWSWSTALAMGIIQSTALIPGWDSLTALLTTALFLNFKREPAAKYAYFALAPILLYRTFSGLQGVSFHSSAPMEDVSWLSFGVALVVSSLVGLLSIGGFMKHIQQKGLTQYVFYRWILGAGVFAVCWLRKG